MQIFNFSVEIEHIIIKYKSKQEFSTLKLVISYFNIEKKVQKFFWRRKIVEALAGLDLMKKLRKPQLALTLQKSCENLSWTWPYDTVRSQNLPFDIDAFLYKEIMKNQKDEAVRVYLYCLLFTVIVSC